MFTFVALISVAHTHHLSAALTPGVDSFIDYSGSVVLQHPLRLHYVFEVGSLLLNLIDSQHNCSTT